MTKNFDDLNETFNVSDDIVKAEVVKKELDNVKSNSDDVKKDYEYTRGNLYSICLLYTSPSPRDKRQSRMPSSA